MLDNRIIRGAEITYVSLLDSPALEDVGSLANLAEQLLVGELDVLSRLVGLPDDGSLLCPRRAESPHQKTPVSDPPRLSSRRSALRRA